MVTADQNRLLTESGPGTPGGKLLRRYWQPIARCSELPPGSPPVPIRIMSEDLVLFRDEQGRIGLLGRQCSHRRTDLSFGRIEDGGLRCLYHGWLYDINGQCLDQPAEPEGSQMKCAVKHKSYPCQEVSGLIFTYMGEGEPPILPDYEFLRQDEWHRNLSKIYFDCNWLQAIEGNIDPSHLSYLHRPVQPVDSRAVPGSGRSADAYYRGDRRPRLDYEQTRYGLRIYSIRRSEEGQYVRITHFLMPNKTAIVGNEGRVGQGYQVNWHVPIDDTHHLRFDIAFNRAKPFSPESNRRLNATADLAPDGHLQRNLGNRYLQNRAEMLTKNFSGMGDSFIVHDAFAVETAGPVHDRTQEFLGTTDVMIVQSRKQLLAAMEAMERGEEPPHVFTRPEQNDTSDIVVFSGVIPADADPRSCWMEKGRRDAALVPGE